MISGRPLFCQNDAPFSPDFISIDLKLQTKDNGKKSHFYWKTSSKESKDFFDAVSGASKLHSTMEFKNIVNDGEQLIPKSLYCLCLFAVSSPEYLGKDGFSAIKSGKKIEINFEHRENRYRICSDEKGFLNIGSSFFMHKKGDLSDELSAETCTTSKNYIYAGRLKAKLSDNGVLTLKGKFIKKQKTERDLPQDQNDAQNMFVPSDINLPPLQNPYLD